MTESVLYHIYVAICFGVQECKVLSRTENMATMWWQRKCSATSTSSPAHFLRSQALHQQFHSYIPLYDSVRGIDIEISDLPSRSALLSDAKLLHYFNTHLSQPLSWQM